MAARIRELRDALLAHVANWWNPVAPSEVVAPYTFDVYAPELVGRKVLIFPESSAGFPATREEDTDDYGFQLWIVERYPDQGRPPDEWTDERLDFVADLEDRVGNPRRVPYFGAHPDWDVYPQEAGVTTIYDVVDLIEQKVFVSVITLLLREDAAAVPE